MLKSSSTLDLEAHLKLKKKKKYKIESKVFWVKRLLSRRRLSIEVTYLPSFHGRFHVPSALLSADISNSGRKRENARLLS